MDPEQRLAIIVENLAVESLVFVLGTVIRMLCPQRVNIGNAHRPFVDLYAVARRRDLNRLLAAVSVVLLFRLRVLMDPLDHNIGVLEITLINRLEFLRRIGLLQEDFNRHEAAVTLQHLAHAVFIRELKAVFVQMQGNGCPGLLPAAIAHRIGRGSVTLPVHRRGALAIAEGIDLDILGNHEHRIEAKTKVADDVVLVCLVLILLEECCRTGKCNLCDVFFDFFCCHAKTCVREADRLRLRVHDDMDGVLVVIRILVLSHDLKLMEL